MSDPLAALRARLHKIAVEEADEFLRDTEVGQSGDGWIQTWNAEGLPIYVDAETGEED